MSSVSKSKSFLIALAIIIGLIFLNFPGVSNEIKNFFYSVSGPIQEKFNHLIRQAENSWEFLNSLRKISQENLELEQKIKELMAQNTELKEIEKENELLRSYLDLPAGQRYQIDLANVMGRDSQGLEKYILIDKGKLAGIEENMPVIVFGNILVGKVVKVFDDFSKVLLITSSNSKIPALIQRGRTEGLIQGMKENLLFLDLIPKDAKIEENQTVVTSGIDGIFPKGLLIGKILKAESSENELFQRVEVKPAIEINKLERVFIIK